MTSTFPSLALAWPEASPDWAARAPAPLAVRAVDLGHGHAGLVEVAGKPGPVGAGALDAHQLDGAEGPQPGQELAVAPGGGLEGLDPKEGPSPVQGGRHVDVEVGVDPAGDPACQSGHRHPFRCLGWGGTAPSGTTDRTAVGLLGRLLLGHSVRPVGVGWVSEPGRQIDRRTVRKDVSRKTRVRPGLGIHPHADRISHRSGGPAQRPPRSLLPEWGHGRPGRCAPAVRRWNTWVPGTE